MPRFDDNILMLTDSYKFSHHKQYPPQTEIIYSYFESRGGKFPATVFYGLQYFIKRFLCGPVVTKDKIDEAEKFAEKHFGNKDIFHRRGWEHILEKHRGFLPVVINAVPEGTVVPYKNVLFTLENTDPECYWLTNYLETLLVQVWYPMTVATNSYAQKQVIADYLKKTGSDLSGLQTKLVDFGVRGSAGMEAAAIGGSGHLCNFITTDNVPAIALLQDYYSADMPGISIPAAEHSTITSWSREREPDALKNMLEQFPTGLVAVVSDSYDIFNACANIWGGELKELIEKRDGTLIIRPDSGDPPTIVCQVLEILTEKFGHSKTSTGHKLLPPYVRVIQGDGISYESLKDILQAMDEQEFAADNVAFGSGGALLQRIDRDTQKCAFKCSFARVAGRNVDVYKDPVTDPGKMSKKGRLTLERTEDGYITTTDGTGEPSKNVLVEVFRDGRLLKEWTLEEVKNRCEVV